MPICKKGLHEYERRLSAGGNRKGCPKCQKEYKRAYRKAHPEMNRRMSRMWAIANPEKISLWFKINADKCRAFASNRKAAKLKRTPKWLTELDWIEIRWAYEIATQKTKETGIEHEVDHIIPLKGKNISGLHCPQNLQILTKSENCRKGNRYAY